MLLALETANDQCSVALYDATGVRALRLDGQSREQTRLLLPMIESVMQEVCITFSEISAIAFSRGPGSFSGIRINAAVTQALAWAHDLPVVPVSSLQATAQHALNTLATPAVTVALDARMNELYVGSYISDIQGLMQADGDEHLLAYDAPLFNQDNTPHVLVGSGCLLVQTDRAVVCHVEVAATAVDIAQLAWVQLQQGLTVDAAHAIPVYLRDNAWKKIDAQKASAQAKQPFL